VGSSPTRPTLRGKLMTRKILLVRPNHTISNRSLNQEITRMNEEMKTGSVVVLPDGWRATVVEVDVAQSSYLPNDDKEWQLICEKRDQERKSI
jgi:nitrogen fixation protein